VPKQPENVVCPRCDGVGLRIEVGKYFWRDKKGNMTVIENALIIKCRRCGEFAATGDEQKRWDRDKNKQEAKERDPDEPCCEECGRPMSLTGQFFTYGYGEDQKGYCRECNDALGLSA
jgi:YgiT-type zinc finger domain-containing protein